ncbi:efflux RND transporter periplasmic adaptor subunit [Nitrosomonas sp. GH22]|uniref:efflux RND transporter periplasmic adaptor subunit n=1 Tax=Nitrosomonas sp. GH22 TaxID=153947 RepID=UPI00136D053C|nr:efflux RND transporter periplasmic adaptor subunit [Nitrosomonas sp. GH22]MXS79341.1 efflux RND transporter periplasmic adaptor subunit [Nitrosomonas sp. GH22]
MSFQIQTIAVVFAFVVLSISGCSSKEEQDSPEKHVKAGLADSHTIFLRPDLRQRVETGKPFLADISEKLHVPGQIKVNETKLVQVGASFTGRIVEVYAHLGDSVAAGAKLARITSPELVQAQLAYLRANSLAVLAERAAIRARQLFAEDVISAAELQRRESESQVSNAELSAAKDQLLLLGVNNQAIQDLTRHGQILPSVVITAPRSGTVITRNVAVGQVVQPSDQLFTVADLSELWVVGDVPEYAAHFVEQGQHVEVRVPALGDANFDGTIIFVSDIVNPLTRTVTVRTEVDNPERKLKPDMLATVHIDEHARERLVIPEGAVVREHNEDHVFVAREDGGFTLTQVKLDEPVNQMRPVLEGLTPDQLIIVKGAFHLNNERKRKDLE